MRTLDSYRKEVERLRKLHTRYFRQEKWASMQTIGTKIIRALDKIKELEEKQDK